MMANKSPQERRAYRGDHDSIPVSFADNIVAGVKTRGDVVRFLDPHGRREQVIQRLDEIRTGNGASGLKIRNLMRGMHTGVCSPRAVDLRWRARQLLESVFQACLDRRSIRLTLPAVKVSSIIGED